MKSIKKFNNNSHDKILYLCNKYLKIYVFTQQTGKKTTKDIQQKSKEQRNIDR